MNIHLRKFSDLIAKLNEEVFSLTTMQYDIAA